MRDITRIYLVKEHRDGLVPYLDAVGLEYNGEFILQALNVFLAHLGRPTLDVAECQVQEKFVKINNRLGREITITAEGDAAYLMRLFKRDGGEDVLSGLLNEAVIFILKSWKKGRFCGRQCRRCCKEFWGSEIPVLKRFPFHLFFDRNAAADDAEAAAIN